MKCSDVESQLSALLDHELSAAVDVEVQQHLDQCPECNQQWEMLRRLDHDMSQLEVPSRLEDRIVASLSSLESDLASPVSTPTDASLSHRAILGWAMAVAALLMLAVWIGKPALEKTGPTTPASPIAATIVRFLGPVHVMPQGHSNWSLLTASEDRALQYGTKLKTEAAAFCELETSQRSIIRLDQNGELVVRSSDEMELIAGRAWCAAASKPVKIISASVPISESVSLIEFTCPSSSEVQLSVEPAAAICTSLSTEQASCKIGQQVHVVEPKKSMLIQGDSSIQQQWFDVPSAKIWQLPLLAVDRLGASEQADELSSILNPLLAGIGRTKASFLQQQQIEALGPPGAIPLLVFALSNDAADQPELRLRAVSIAAQISGSTALPWWRKLADDPQSQVKEIAQQAIERLAS